MDTLSGIVLGEMKAMTNRDDYTEHNTMSMKKGLNPLGPLAFTEIQIVECSPTPTGSLRLKLYTRLYNVTMQSVERKHYSQ